MTINKSQRGVSLYLAIIIMTILLAIALGLSTIFLGQVVMLREMGYSVIAFYAADTGIEQILMNRGSPSNLSGYLDLNNNNAKDSDDSSYEVIVTAPGSDCTASNFCVKSIGTYQEVSRAIEITY